MHTSYTTSVRCTSSFSYYSVSDYTSYIHDTNPILLPSQSCCPCCAKSSSKNTINPNFLYGWRQSRLISYRPPRKLIMSGAVHSYPQFPICDTEPKCNYQKSHSFKGRISSGRKGRWRNGNFGYLINEERRNTFKSRNAGDADLILSLLTEEVCEDILDVRERSCKERNGRSARIPQVEKTKERAKVKNGSSKFNYKLVESGAREEDNRYREEERNQQEKKNEKEKKTENEILRERKGGSTCSSYYSLSSQEENESDNEVQNKEDEIEIVRDSSSEYNRNQNVESEEKITSDRNQRQEIHLEKKNSGANRVEFDWRKKSEKKLAEVLIEQEKSKKESSHRLLSSSEININRNAKNRETKSASALRIDEGKREKFSEIHNEVTRQSKSKLKYGRGKETEQIKSSVDKASSSSDKQYKGREDYRVGAVQQQPSKASEIQESGISDNYSRVEQADLGQLVMKKTNLRRRSQQTTETSDTLDANTESIVISEGNSSARIKNHAEASSSYQESEKQHTQMDSKTVTRLKFNKESNIITDAENVSTSGYYTGVSSEEKSQTSSPISQLDSADKSQKIATHFINEFVEKAKDEISTSEIRNKQTDQPGSRDSEPKEQSSRRSSSSSGAKGPSDEMWALNNPSLTIVEPPKTEVLEDSNKAVVRRSGWSMWSMVSHIVRMRWGSRSETRSLPNPSTSSEAWYSGQEQEGGGQSQHEASSDGDLLLSKGKSTSSTEETSAGQEQEGGGQSQHEASSDGDLLLSKGKSTSSTEESSAKPLEGRLGTQITRLTAPIPATEETSSESLQVSLDTQITRPTASMPATEETSAEPLKGSLGTQITRPSPAMRMRRSPPVREEIVSAEMKEISGTVSKDEELKRAKLQRSKQLPKDRFDEWEEAFVVENEQRKMDEMFMKEALLEAKKAGDMWEVPVGAVLVHYGKIIARGYNLVEELRDSTAHAEMNCIREASNVLQSWRLSETTLYVTLEPCPMCAGAILQARVDTVVWGAPNKLLGADGSWIRLFPNRGEEGSDTASAPVHPFHPNMKVRRGVLSSECANVMQEFFQFRRRKKEKKPEAVAPPPTPPPSRLPISNNSSKLLSKMHHVFHSLFCL